MSDVRYEIPAGLEIAGMSGSVDGVLVIAGTVRDANIKTASLVLKKSGSLTRCEVKTASLVVEGKISDGKVALKHFVATAGSVVQDTAFEVDDVGRGVAIDAEAVLDGDIKFQISKQLPPVTSQPVPAEQPAQPVPATNDPEPSIELGSDG